MKFTTKVLLLFFYFIILSFGALAQCANIYFYRFNSLLQSEVPVYLQYNGEQIATLQLGSRYQATICTPGTYSFIAKKDPNGISLSKTTIEVEAGKDYYVKIYCSVGIELAIIEKKKTVKGVKDINKNNKFIGQVKTISIGSSSAIISTGGNPSPINSSTFQRTQIVDNFKFDMVEVIKAGDRLELKYKITNMASDDRIISSYGSDIFFYDDLGNLLSANEVCIMNNCREFRTIDGLSNAVKKGRTRGTNSHVSPVVPYGIPVNARIVINGVKNSASRFVRGQMMFHIKNKEGKNGHDIKLVYNNFIFPTEIDSNNPNKRNVGSQSFTLMNSQQEGESTVLHYQLKNNSKDLFLLKISKKSIFFDDEGSQHLINGVAFISKLNRVSDNEVYSWEHQVLGGQQIDFYVFLDQIPNTVKQLSRGSLDLEKYSLSWDKINVNRQGNSSPSSASYISYTDFENKVSRKEDLIGKKIILERLYFSSGSNDILPSSHTQLNQLALLLQNNIYLEVEVSGHTDNVGEDLANMLLSQKRADAVKYYLIGKSISPSRITSIGKGQSEPRGQNATASGKKENRRVEIKIVK